MKSTIVFLSVLATCTSFMPFTTYATKRFERNRGQVIENVDIHNSNGIMIAVTTSFTIDATVDVVLLE